MSKHKTIPVVQGIVCVIAALMLCLGAAGIYREGIDQIRAGGDELAWIYTPERITAHLMPVLPFLALSIALTAASMIIGIKNSEDMPLPSIQGRNTHALPKPQYPSFKNCQRTVFAVRLIIVLLSAAMILGGILNGSMRDVLVKAVNLCMECVGLG